MLSKSVKKLLLLYYNGSTIGHGEKEEWRWGSEICLIEEVEGQSLECGEVEYKVL